MSELSIVSRAEGVAVGAAVGDLLGSTVEGYDLRKPILEQYDYADFDEADPANRWKIGIKDMVGHIQANGGRVTEYMGHLGTGFWEYGETTDDTSQWAIAAESLLERGEFDPADIARRFVRWFDGGKGRGLGGTTLMALRLQDPAITNPPLAWNEAGYAAVAEGKKYIKLPRYERGWEMQAQPANGAVMRTSVLGVYTPLREDYDKLAAAAHDMAIITHAFDECIGSAQVVSELVARLMNGQDKHIAVSSVADRYNEHFEKAIDAITSPEGHTGGTYETTGVAITSLLRADTFRAAVEHAVNATVDYHPWANDVDTYAAVTGALAGAYWGYEAIPESWQRPIHPVTGERHHMIPYHANYLRALARELIAAS